jgi:phage baseplate assembly protein W
MATVTLNTTREFSDLDLNFTIHPVRKDINRTTGDMAVINSIKNLVLTNHYERPFQPEVGSNVRRLLFENLYNITASSIEKEIEQVIKNFEPRARVTKINAVKVVVALTTFALGAVGCSFGPESTSQIIPESQQQKLDDSTSSDEAEIGYLLAAVARLFPTAAVGRDDVQQHYCGVRPLPNMAGDPHLPIEYAYPPAFVQSAIGA